MKVNSIYACPICVSKSALYEAVLSFEVKGLLVLTESSGHASFKTFLANSGRMNEAL